MSDENTAALKNFMDLQDALERKHNITNIDDFMARDLIACGLVRGVEFDANGVSINWEFVSDKIEQDWLKDYMRTFCDAEDMKSDRVRKMREEGAAMLLKTNIENAARSVAYKYCNEIMEKFASIDELQEFIYTEV